MLWIRIIQAMALALAFSEYVRSQSVNPKKTHCSRYLLSLEIRCDKRDYQADKIVIKNISNRHVSFKISEYDMICGTPGRNYANHDASLAPGETVKYTFKATSEVSPSITTIGEMLKKLVGRCNLFTIYSCSSIICRNDIDVWIEDQWKYMWLHVSAWACDEAIAINVTYLFIYSNSYYLFIYCRKYKILIVTILSTYFYGGGEGGGGSSRYCILKWFLHKTPVILCRRLKMRE